MSEKRLAVSARRVTSVACPRGSFPTLSVSASIVHSLCHYNVYPTSERSKGIFRSLYNGQVQQLVVVSRECNVFFMRGFRLPPRYKLITRSSVTLRSLICGY